MIKLIAVFVVGMIVGAVLLMVLSCLMINDPEDF